MHMSLEEIDTMIDWHLDSLNLLPCFDDEDSSLGSVSNLKHESENTWLPSLLNSTEETNSSSAVDPVVANLAARLACDSEALELAGKLAGENQENIKKNLNPEDSKPKLKRKRKRPVPDHLKDAAYWRKREKNTLLARKYRQRKRELKNKVKTETAEACSKLSKILGVEVL
eukprot:m.45945 g.45945  ORF g.45945 m.45945 type:complete len:171 (-) comp10309_c0_seq4:1485-1997(-)